MKKTTVEIPVIREFLNNWKKEAMEYFQNQLEAYRTELAPVSRSWEKRNALRKKYGELIYKANMYGNSATEYLQNEIDIDAEGKYYNIVSKIQKICGEVTDAKNLYIASNGELNGFIFQDTAEDPLL